MEMFLNVITSIASLIVIIIGCVITAIVLEGLFRLAVWWIEEAVRHAQKR